MVNRFLAYGTAASGALFRAAGARIALLPLGALILATACGSSDDRAPRTRTWDSAGILIVESAPPDSADRVHIDAKPHVLFGHGTADTNHHFVRISSVLRLSNGNIAVFLLNGVSRLFDSTGAFLAPLTRRGSGPGEITFFLGAEVSDGDTIKVQGPTGLMDVHWFSGDGKLQRVSSHRDEPPQVVHTRRQFEYAARDSTGWPAQTTTYALEFRGADTVVTVAIGKTHRRELFNRYLGIQTIFEQSPLNVIGASSVYAIPASDHRSEIQVFGLGGKQRAIWRLRRAPIAVSALHKSQYLEHYTGPAGELQNDRRMLAERGIYAAWFPSYLDIKRGRDERIWVRDYVPPWEEKTVNRWFVFDTTGALQGFVNLDPRFTPHEFATEWVLGVLLDEMDVEGVALYRLRGQALQRHTPLSHHRNKLVPMLAKERTPAPSTLHYRAPHRVLRPTAIRVR